MTFARFVVGDTLTVLRSMPDASVDLFLSSPPFLALRSYLPADHPDKVLEIGSEATPGAFVDVLLDVIEECRRVLAPHGSLVFELGDSFSGSGGAGGDYADAGWRAGQERFGGSASRSRAVESHWSTAQATWLAGVIDTEGYIGVRRQEAARQSPSYAATVRVTMMDHQVCDRASEITGVGTIIQDGRGAFSWSVVGQQARYVLTNIWPHLLIKQRQAMAAVELQRHVEEKRRRGKYDRIEPADLTYRQMIREYVQGLNARGEQRGTYVPTWTPPTPPRIHHAALGVHDGWPLDKSLCLVPELLRLSMAYGFNPLTGRTTPRWRIRNVHPWLRPNPPVGALADKFRPATSYLFSACVGRKRYFDLDAVRAPDGRAPSVQAPSPKAPSPKALVHQELGHHGKGMPATGTWHANGGAPPLDWLLIPTQPYKGSHYATWPEALCVPFVLAMSPAKVCRECGRPSERVTGEPEYLSVRGATKRGMSEGQRRDEGVNQWTASDGTNGSGWVRSATTTGWTDCGHDAYRPGVVCDPFAGTFVTGAVAHGHGRSAIGIDLDARNADLARERVGMWLEVEHHSAALLTDPAEEWVRPTVDVETRGWV